MPHHDSPAPLFTPLTLRGLTLRNRIAVAPMCQYSAVDGVPQPWHLVHLGSRAVGGAALVIAEATAVTPRGRISPADLGLWNDIQTDRFAQIVRFVHEQGAAAGVQLAHAGRKASTQVPWRGRGMVSETDGGWTPAGPSALAFDGRSAVPHELTLDEIAQLVTAFVDAARRADAAGFDVVEIHAAHGYLLHEFLSPLSNARTDEYGGSFDKRTRFPLEVVRAVRDAWTADKPLLLRISATDWVDGGWSLDEATRFAVLAQEAGVDLVDTSSGGLDPRQEIVTGPGYQVPFARALKSAGVTVGAVGEITEAEQANDLIEAGDADLVLVARELLRDPYAPLHWAARLGAEPPVPNQYLRAFPQPSYSR